MLRLSRLQFVISLLTFGILVCASGRSAAAVRIEGLVQAGDRPLANATVTLWVASAGEPKQLAQTTTNGAGQFELGSQETPGTDMSLYLVAKSGGENPAVALLSVLGNTPPTKVVINEMTTVASVWTHAQFLDGTAIKGNALGLKIAASNVPNFVDLETGRMRSTARKQQRWRILPRSLVCWPVARPRLDPMLVRAYLPQRHRLLGKRHPIRWQQPCPLHATLHISREDFLRCWMLSIPFLKARRCDALPTCRI
jgi:hypothetical protein